MSWGHVAARSMPARPYSQKVCTQTGRGPRALGEWVSRGQAGTDLTGIGRPHSSKAMATYLSLSRLKNLFLMERQCIVGMHVRWCDSRESA